MNRKTITGSFLVLIALLMFIFRGSSIFLVDDSAEEYFNHSISTATKILISVMAIDSVLSILKDTEPTIDLFAGVNFAAGEVVNPAEDMVDRLTNVITISIVSLSIQRLLHEVGKNEVTVVLSFLFLMIGLNLIRRFLPSKPFRYLINLTVLLIVLRLLLPISAGISFYVENTYFKQKIEESMDKVVIDQEKFEKLKRFDTESSSGVWKSVVATKNMIVDKGSMLIEIVLDKIKNFDQFIAAMIQIAGSYLLLFIIQVLLLPILFILGAKYIIFRT